MLLVVPGPDEEPWPTLGGQVCDLIEDRGVYGPGSLQGEPYRIDPEFRAFLYRAYELYPKGHEFEGRRRFKRVGLSVRKGLAKTEKEALIVFAELHPEAPVRFDGWDANGEPVGRPVKAPYIPMLAATVEQVEELAFGALTYIVQHSPDEGLFDVTLERIIRLDEFGRDGGKAVPLSNAPGARDGARTTLNAYDEPHRLHLPRAVQAYNTMEANLPKRPLEDPWSLAVGTAGQLGQNSVAEMLHQEAQEIEKGNLKRPDLFYLYRTDDDPHRDLSDKKERIKAVAEATGPAGEWGPGQFDDIASQWDRPKADKAYLERVWLNRWVVANTQAFDMNKINPLVTGEQIPKGAFITLGFDGARSRDTTALVATDVETGLQECLGVWARPDNVPEDEYWEIDSDEVTQTLERVFADFDVHSLYADPPHWREIVGDWSARWPNKVIEWETKVRTKITEAIQAYLEAIDTSSVSYGGAHLDEFLQHLANAGRRDVNMWTDDGERLFILQKQNGQNHLKFDIAMAAILSWKARLDAVKRGATPQPVARAPRRIY